LDFWGLKLVFEIWVRPGFKYQKGDIYMLKLLALKDAYLKNEEGATAIEYGLIAAGISLAIVAVVFTFGDQLETTFTSMETAMSNANDQVETGN
jgi:pilus assembly protein Flp/PilA